MSPSQQFFSSQEYLDALPGYQAELARIKDACMAHLDAWYGQENRWPDSPYWQRRRCAGRMRRA